MGRGLWLLLGFGGLVCGLVGLILPLVPTTPFLLVAAFGFARSSPVLHSSLLRHPRLGPPIHDWQAYGAISRRSKAMAVAALVATAAVSLGLGLEEKVLLGQAAILLVVGAFVLSRPDPPVRSDRHVENLGRGTGVGDDGVG